MVFRVDAVANMLYWNKEGKEQSNEHAVSFFRELNEAVFAEDEGVILNDSGRFNSLATCNSSNIRGWTLDSIINGIWVG